MAYEKYTWVDGELITAEKLNHMEDGIAEGGDCGFTCTETTEQLFTETVTTAESGGDYLASLNYAEPIEADELIVVFNGTEYVCSKIVDSDVAYYGGIDPNTATIDFTNYPFAISSHPLIGNEVVTESPMTATISVSVTSSTVETTECFEKAVKSVAGNGYECTETTEQLFDETVTTADHDGVNSSLLAYSEPITAGELDVIFNDAEYRCPKIIVGGFDNPVFYGGMSETGVSDFTNYPFIISSDGNTNMILTPTANTYYIDVAAVVPEATNISPCFASAVKKSSDSSVKIKTATLSADNVSVDGSEAVLLSVPDDYSATVGVITIYPLETEDVYLADFDCSGDRNRLYLNYKSKQSSPVTIDHVECVFTYIPESGDK